MAEVIAFVDDLDGTPLDRDEAVIVEFSFKGKTYRLDLSRENAQKFGDALDPFISKAKRLYATERAAERAARHPVRRTRTDLNEVREWATQNGYEVADRGRVKREILEAYDAAQAALSTSPSKDNAPAPKAENKAESKAKPAPAKGDDKPESKAKGEKAALFSDK